MLNTHASCCHGVWYCETGRLHSTFIVCSYCRYKDLTVEIFVAAELSPASVVYRYQSDDLHARLRYDNRPRPISDYYNTVVYRVCTESYYEWYNNMTWYGRMCIVIEKKPMYSERSLHAENYNWQARILACQIRHSCVSCREKSLIT